MSGHAFFTGTEDCMTCHGSNYPSIKSSLPMECPGMTMTDAQKQGVQTGVLDYFKGEWWILSRWWVLSKGYATVEDLVEGRCLPRHIWKGDKESGMTCVECGAVKE